MRSGLVEVTVGPTRTKDSVFYVSQDLVRKGGPYLEDKLDAVYKKGSQLFAKWTLTLPNDEPDVFQTFCALTPHGMGDVMQQEQHRKDSAFPQEDANLIPLSVRVYAFACKLGHEHASELAKRALYMI